MHFYSTNNDDGEKKHNILPVTDCQLMTLASILPLARLSSTRNGHVMLLDKNVVTRNIPGDLLSVVSVGEWIHSIQPIILDDLPIVSEENDFKTVHDAKIGAFLFVKQCNVSGIEDSQTPKSIDNHAKRRQSRRHNRNIMGTIIDFAPISATIKYVLQNITQSSSSLSEKNRMYYDKTISPISIKQLPSILRTISYTLLSLFWSHGMSYPGTQDMVWLKIESTFTRPTSESDNNKNELVARSQAVSDFAGVLGYVIVSRIGSEEEENNLHLSRRVCNILVQLSKSKSQKVMRPACCGLISLLSSLRYSFGKRSTTKEKVYDDALSDSLVTFIEHACSVIKEESITCSDLILIPLVDGKCVSLRAISISMAISISWPASKHFMI